MLSRGGAALRSDGKSLASIMGMTSRPECGKHPFMDERVKQWLSQGREYYHKHDFEQAEKLLGAVVEQQKGYADVFNMLGVMAHERGEFEKAEHHFEAATRINPSYTEALLNLAVTYNDQAKYEAARQIYQQIRNAREKSKDRIDPFAKGKIANMHADLATAYEEAGLPEEAIHELERAVSLCPGFVDLRSRLGVLHRDAGNLQAARQQFEAAREINPRYAQARVMLGITLLSLNEVDAALAEWNAALEHDPGNKSAQMYIRMVENSRKSVRPPPVA
jgi:tetratricopeptide (TPR) repeat protein